LTAYRAGGQANLSGLHQCANREPLAISRHKAVSCNCTASGMTIGSESGYCRNVSSPKRIKPQTSAGASITIDKSGIAGVSGDDS
jgi:hypothetical protein